MPVFQKTIHVRTQGNGDVLDVTAQISRAVAESGMREGIVNVAGRGSTLGITTLEYEPGCVADLQRALETLAPADGDYAHNARWGDDNGYAHLRSAARRHEPRLPARRRADPARHVAADRALRLRQSPARAPGHRDGGAE